ncbi:hypothetical protein RI054_13g64340 [Pseudoscourfieldia marina]
MPMPEAMETHGRSASLKKQQGTVRAAFEAFGECDEECAKVYGGGLDQLSEETLCHEDVVRRFATFLVEDWRAAGTGEHIGGATVLQYLSVLMNIIVNKYRSSDDAKTKKFCLSLAKHAPEGAWYRGLKAEVRKLCFKRALENGESLDNSATPVGFQQVKRMAVALAHRSTPRAMETKFALRQTWASGGRAAESAYLLYTGLKWDYDQQCTVGLWPQLKTFKVKLAVFVAGIDASTCYYTDWGDVMALSQPPIFEDGEACFLNTKLSLAAHPARVLGASMKDLRKDCPELPEDVSAGGLRPGVVNYALMHVDPMFLCHTTGHDGKGFSNLFEYMDASVAMAIPGAVVLAGWPALPRALGKAPVPADLFCLVTQGNRERMELFVDALFNMHSAAPPMLLQNGDLRPPSARAPPALSCTIRSESERGGTLRPCQAIETVEGMKLYDPGASADTTLIRWSAE